MKYAVIRQRKLKVVHRKRLARDVLYDAMVNFESKANKIVAVMIEMIKSTQKSNYQELKILYTEFRRCSELACDYATKLAPYQSPKLESIEVKSEVEHRFVLRVPHQMKSVEEWAKLTGANKIKIEDITKIENQSKPVVIDHEDEESDYVEPGMTQH